MVDWNKPLMLSGYPSYQVAYVGEMPNGRRVVAYQNPTLKEEDDWQYYQVREDGVRPFSKKLNIVNRPERKERFIHVHRDSSYGFLREVPEVLARSCLAVIKVIYEDDKVVGVELVEDDGTQRGTGPSKSD